MKKTSKKVNIFFGTASIAVPILQALRDHALDPELIVSQPDKISPKGVPQQSPVSEYARAHNLRLITPTSLQDESFVNAFKNINPEYCILVAYGNIIPKNLLVLPPHGWINVHPSLLPRWRGAAPIQNAILHGDQETGTTIMKMDEGVDTGPILSQQKIVIDSKDTSITLSTKLGALSGKLLCASLPNYLEKKLKLIEQDSSPTPLTKRLAKKDGRINWMDSAQHIEQMIRAYTPWPSTFTIINNEQIKILSATVTKEKTNKKPGSIVAQNKTIHIATGSYMLRIEKLQRPGKKPMGADQFTSGYQLDNLQAE